MISATAILAGYAVALILAPRPTVWLTGLVARGGGAALRGGARLAATAVRAASAAAGGGVEAGGDVEADVEAELLFAAHWALGMYVGGRRSPEHTEFYAQVSRAIHEHRVRELRDLRHYSARYAELLAPAVDAARAELRDAGAAGGACTACEDEEDMLRTLNRLRAAL